MSKKYSVEALKQKSYAVSCFLNNANYPGGKNRDNIAIIGDSGDSSPDRNDVNVSSKLS